MSFNKFWDEDWRRWGGSCQEIWSQRYEAPRSLRALTMNLEPICSKLDDTAKCGCLITVETERQGQSTQWMGREDVLPPCSVTWIGLKHYPSRSKAGCGNGLKLSWSILDLCLVLFPFVHCSCQKNDCFRGNLFLSQHGLCRTHLGLLQRRDFCGCHAVGVIVGPFVFVMEIPHGTCQCGFSSFPPFLLYKIQIIPLLQCGYHVIMIPPPFKRFCVHA